MTLSHAKAVKAGRLGGKAGKGKSKRRGDKAFYAALGRLGGKAGTGASKVRKRKK